MVLLLLFIGKAKLKACLKVLFKLQVIHSARANASHNHGLNADRLIVGNISYALNY